MEESKLKKALTPIGLWAIAVGAVISGMYYGWNYIFASTNFLGAVIALVIATLFYVTFMFLYAELATAVVLPQDSATMRAILETRLPEVPTEAKKKRIEKALRKLRAA